MARTSSASRLRTPPQPAFVARAFASDVADLAVRIDPQQPTASVDALLAGCLRASDGEAPRRWPVARRLGALIAIRRAGGVTAEPVELRCPHCDELFEIGIDLDAFAPRETPERIAFDVGGRRFEARCPTGEDQARWQAERPPLRLVAASLLETQDAPDDAVLAGLEAALARNDPARELPVATACPACAQPVETCVHLETQLLQAFAAEQRAWLGEIAAVARCYPWSEAEIAAMPAWRRRHYLARADALGAVR